MGDFNCGRVLDIGCGPAMIGNSFLGRSIQYYGLDVSPEMIKECVASFDNDPKFQFFIGDMEELPFSDSCFDVVLCLGAFEYAVDGDAACREIVRVLTPKGIVIITMLNEMSPYRLWNQFIYEKIINVTNRVVSQITGEKSPRETKRSNTKVYREKDFKRLMMSCRLEIEDTVYYDYNLFLPPLDIVFPGISVYFSRKLEYLCRSKIKSIGTGYILKCRKS